MKCLVSVVRVSMAKMWWIARDRQRTVGNVASKVPSDNAVPRRSFAVVELLGVSEERGNGGSRY